MKHETVEAARQSGDDGTARTVYVAIAANAAIAAAKFIAAVLGGSSAMVSEGIHSLVDTANEVLLLIGLKQSRRQPDRDHPFGHGHEIYFYALLVAVSIFGAGGAVSIYEGIRRMLDPVRPEHVVLSYIVIGVAAAFETISETVALRQFTKTNRHGSLWAAMRASKDPTTFMVVFEDAAGLLGLLWAGAGLFLSTELDWPMADGLGSVLIGVTLCVVALILLRETKGLLVGEAVEPDLLEELKEILASDAAVDRVGRVLTMHMGPNQILVNAELRFSDRIAGREIADAVIRLEERMRRAHAEITNVFIEPTHA